jgi:23S rRNA pseudouridine2605 synthase
MPRRSPRPPLVRFLAKCDVAPRGEARALVREGRVTVNGRVCTEGAVRVDPRSDRVEVDGRRVRLPDPRSFVWVALNKPRGVVTTTKDPEGRKTVLDLLPPTSSAGLAPVGRLDQASAGLLLLTNESETAAALLDPGTHLPKVYRVKVRGHPTEATLEAWRRQARVVDGLRLGPMGARVERTGPVSTWLQLTLIEGKNRQIRRRCAADGHAVEQLIRVAFGPIRLKDLLPGRARRLTRDEVASLRRLARRFGGPKR